MSTINKIIIVGGGSAGWMSAAALINEFPNKEIIVLEPEDIPTIGVGESTIQYIRPWMYSLGIKDEDWMEAANATYKVSIRFENWDGKGGHFHYPFGMPVYNSDIDFDLYNFARLNGDVPDNEWAEIFFPAALMSENNLLVDKMPSWDLQKNSAYHFDAVRFAQWLKNEYCIPRGVKVINQYITAVDTDLQGVTRLHCDCERPQVPFRGNTALTADLYIDCTGFKGLLAEAVGIKWRDYSSGLINDSAWATQLPENYPEQYYTNCTALENGWVWNTPTKERTGTGYVFSSRYVDDEQALEEFKKHLNRDDELDFRLLKWKHGRREKFAFKNVVTVGLSAGFLEPLEAGGLFATHETLKQLVKAMQRGTLTGAAKEGFNYAVTGRFDDFADFLVMHYQYATRDDTPYWRDVSKFKLNNNNALEEFYQSTYSDSMVIPHNVHYNAIAFGQGINTVSNYDVRYENLFAGEDMISRGVEFRKHLLKRQKEWLEHMKKNSI
jgi:tryptophan halogenase